MNMEGEHAGRFLGKCKGTWVHARRCKERRETRRGGLEMEMMRAQEVKTEGGKR